MKKSLQDQLKNLSAPPATPAQQARAKQYAEHTFKQWFEAFQAVSLDSPDFWHLVRHRESKAFFYRCGPLFRIRFLQMLERLNYELYLEFQKIHEQAYREPSREVVDEIRAETCWPKRLKP